MNIEMEYVLAALAAALSFSVNRLLVKRWEALTVVALGPVVEESAKTLLAYYLGANILITHLLFGVIEGVADFWRSERFGARAALLSVAGHGAFGALTVLLLNFTASVVLALMGAVIVHIFWNAAVNRLAGRQG